MTKGHKAVPLKYIDKCKLSICKIKYKNGKGNNSGTGFFLRHKLNHYLITNYHIISEDVKTIEIEIWNENKTELYLNNKYIRYLKRPKDITIIKIKSNEIKDIQFLNCDLNYLNGYNQYINTDIFTIGYPGGIDIAVGSGTIKKIEEYKIYHDIPTEGGSSGSPIILFNILTVIGIHRGGIEVEEINIGTFIGEIFNELNKKDNEIICIYNKNEESISLLYNYFFNSFNMTMIQIIDYKKQIKQSKQAENINEMNLEMYVNNKKINFTYDYKSNELKKINVRYKFDKLLTSTYQMFSLCSSLESIDLSNIGLSNVTDMSEMFSGCYSLKSIDLTDIDLSNVTDMSKMFSECSSLKSISLTDIDLSKVTNMSEMFSGCSSLELIDLYNIDSRNVIDLSYLFSKCYSLKSINISSFNTSNVEKMNNMLDECRSLESIDLSSFDTRNVIDMSNLFNKCYSLKSIDLSLFDTRNVKFMNQMFCNCKSLKKIDLSSFNTINVTHMGGMFCFCNSLEFIDLSSFNFDNVIDKRDFTFSCIKLKKENIKLNNNQRKNVFLFD